MFLSDVKKLTVQKQLSIPQYIYYIINVLYLAQILLLQFIQKLSDFSFEKIDFSFEKLGFSFQNLASLFDKIAFLRTKIGFSLKKLSYSFNKLDSHLDDWMIR